ncbi:MAG: sulfotransferase domain-containing protein [Planctomycetota bacterium]
MLDFLIIGAQKAGSTYLQQLVGDHPDLYTPHGETTFFQDPDYSPDGFEAMIAGLRAAAGTRRIGIKRPNYLAEPEVPERVKRHAPDVRLVAVLRDPRERAISAYFHLMRSRLLPIEPIELGLPRVLDGDYTQRWPTSPTLLGYGRYAEQIKRWREHFPPEQLLVQFHQDIKTRATEMASEAFAHLLVDGAKATPQVHRRPMAGVYSLWRQRFNVLQRAIGRESFDEGRRTRPRANPVSAAAAATLRKFDKLVLARVFPARPPKLSPELRDRLTDYYADDVRELAELTKRDLSAWLA